MQTFKDANGKAWTIEVNVITRKQVKAALDLDLFAVVDGTMQQRLAGDAGLLVDALYLLCKEQADKDGVSDDQFGRALVGDAIERATDALMAGIADFFPSSQRGVMLKMIDKSKALGALAVQRANEAIDRLDPAAILATASSVPSGSSADSAESTRAD